MNINKLSQRDKKRAFIRSRIARLRIKGREIALSSHLTPAAVSRYLNGVDRDLKKKIRPVLAALILNRECEVWGAKSAVRAIKPVAWALDLDINEIPVENNLRKAA